jgi:Spy/CpxP family protein refolding chaperone
MSYGVQSAGLFGSTSQSDGSSSSLRPFANLDLTEDQRTQIRAIFKTAKTEGLTQAQIQQQILALLTPTQQTTFQSDVAAQSSSSQQSQPAGQPPPPGGNPFADPNGPFANLNLTSSQQSQISSILQNGKSQGLSLDQINSQIDTVLTTSQQATFTTDLANVQTAQANVSGQSQSGSGGTSATSTLTESDIQQQIAAATSLILKQLQSEVGISS